MVSLIVVLTFFWMVLIFYPAMVLVVSVGAWLMKKFGKKAGDEASEIRRCRQIDLKKDRLKEILFTISVVLIFFVASPFAVFYYLF